MWFFLAIMIVGGVYAFIRLGKREDSTFVIKSAVVTCPYPGATPEEVERLVTAARTQHQNDELRIQDNLGVALRSGAPYGRALARNVCRPHASAVGRAAAQGIRRRPAAARGRGGDKRRRRLRRRIRHVLCAALRRRLYVERAARLCARSANAPIHGRRGAEGNALRRADAGGGYLYKHIDAGQFRHTPR